MKRSAEDVIKLPVWAQNRISQLENSVEHYRALAAIGPEDSNTFAHQYSAARKPLGTDTDVVFVVESYDQTIGNEPWARDKRYFTAKLSKTFANGGPVLEVGCGGNDKIVVLGLSTNNIQVRLVNGNGELL